MRLTINSCISEGLLTITVSKPCGHIICQPCVKKFMAPHDTIDPHATKEEQEHTAGLQGRILCYVCEADVTPGGPPRDDIVDVEQNGKKKKKSKKDKEGILPGLVEVCSEGTGFAGRGGNVATKTGVAFQC